MANSCLANVKVGFIPLTDSAPLVVAKELGFFEQNGLDVELQVQHSWATLRDKLQTGMLDAAQLLAPMPLASQLGLGGHVAKIITPMVISLNGNAVTLSNTLCQQILEVNQLESIPLPMPARLLQNVIEHRTRLGQGPIRLANVFAYSCHHYQLHQWLLSGGFDVQQIDIVVLPPVNMVDALLCGDIDGFCVGGPWNAKAVRIGAGQTMLTSFDICPDSPEKVLGLLESYYGQHPERVVAMCNSLLMACKWLQSTPNRFEAARLLSSRHYLNAPIDVIAPSLLGSCLVSIDKPPREVPRYNQFYSQDADMNAPDAKYSQWLLEQMLATGQISPTSLAGFQSSLVFRQDIYQKVLANKT